MRQSYIGNILQGNIISGGSFGNESFYDDYEYDEDFDTALETLSFDMEQYASRIADLDTQLYISVEGWDVECDDAYDLATESFAAIKNFFTKYANKLSNALKSLWQKISVTQKQIDKYRNAEKGLQAQKKKLLQQKKATTDPAARAKIDQEINKVNANLDNLRANTNKYVKEQADNITAFEAQKARDKAAREAAKAERKANI